MSDERGGGWYISGDHARRAVGFLTGALPELRNVEVPRLAEAWGRALQATIEDGDLSPIDAQIVLPERSA